jgi:hypothetical protein
VRMFQDLVLARSGLALFNDEFIRTEFLLLVLIVHEHRRLQ